jgi:kynurenine formamidase
MAATGTDVAAGGETAGYSDDLLGLSTHAATHWDALAHVFHKGMTFNYRACTQVTSRGARANEISAVARTMTTRGVLCDVARHRGLDALPPHYEVTVRDLEGTLDAEGVEVRKGDALLVRTGHLGQIRRRGAWTEFAGVDGVLPAEPG